MQRFRPYLIRVSSATNVFTSPRFLKRTRLSEPTWQSAIVHSVGQLALHVQDERRLVTAQAIRRRRG